MMERKTVSASYKVTPTNGAGTFTGLGAVFGNEDFGGDIIVKGAFDNTLSDIQARSKTLPILWQHDWDNPVGPWNDLSTTDDGLMAEGKLLIGDVQRATEAHALLKTKTVSGLSIGFRIPKGGFEYDGEIRYLKEIDLHEISIVTFPMNDEARIDAVKAAELTQRELERILTQDAKLSRTVARQILSGGFKAIDGKQDAVVDDELVQLMKDRAALLL